MKLPAYPRTKPSGVEWLGDVPEHWEVKQLGYGARLQGGYAFASDKFDSEGVPVVRMNNLKRGMLDLSEASCVTPENCLDDFALAEGDLLWGMSGSIGETGSLGNFARVRSRDLPAQMNQRVGRFCVIDDPSSLDFLTFVIQTKLFYDQILLRVTGTAQFNVSSEQVQSAKIPFPPVPEQVAIAAFLDRETGRLDRLVAKKRELIERLKEKRAALISRTVTRGLPPAAARATSLPENPPLKPSGLEWLGDIPKHWEVWKHAHLFTSSMGQTILKEQVADSGLIPVLSATEEYEVFGYLDSAPVLLDAGDLVIPARGNSIGHVKLVRERSTTTQTTIYSKHLTKKVAPKYAFYFLLGHRKTLFHFDRTAIPQLTVNQVSTNPFLLPPLPEQAAIAAYLDLETAKLDALAGKVEEAVERLQEYRTALITAAVTGKIDVRKEVAA